MAKLWKEVDSINDKLGQMVNQFSPADGDEETVSSLLKQMSILQQLHLPRLPFAL